MTNYEYHKVGEPSQKATDTIENIFDEISMAEVERQTYKNLLMALIRSERLHAALEMYDMAKYNK